MEDLRYAPINESITLYWSYRRLVNPFTGERALYDPTTPTLLIELPDGTVLPAITAVTRVAVGEYAHPYIFDALGDWAYTGVEPDSAQRAAERKTITIYAP
jgi:hypothetical protein